MTATVKSTFELFEEDLGRRMREALTDPEFRAEIERERANEHAAALAEFLLDKHAIAAPDVDTLCEFLQVCDDPALDVADLDSDGTDTGNVVTALDRFMMNAERSGHLWIDSDDRCVLFLDLNTGHQLDLDAVLTTDNRSAFPTAQVFPAAVDLPYADLKPAFGSVGLYVHDYGPYISEDALNDFLGELTEAFEMPDYGVQGKSAVSESAEVVPNAPLNLRRLRTEERTPVEYFEPGVIPRNRYIGLSGEAGAGKSVLIRDVAVCVSLGRAALDPDHRFKPAQVVYLDAENGPEWWADGLDKMDAPLDLPNLRVVTYPDLDGGIDTERGARSFLRLIESLGDIDLLIFDTASRFIAGSENDSDTWHSLYRLAIQPLRRAGIGVIRLDHLGKNAELGARGSSAKMSDIDAHYILTATAKGSNSLTLKLDKRRQNDYDETVRIQRRDNPLTHTRIPDGKLRLPTVAGPGGREMPEDDKVAALVAELDRLHIAASLRVRDQRDAYKDKSGTVRASSDVWTAALAFRRDRIDREAEQ